jgi:hypothetical protein
LTEATVEWFFASYWAAAVDPTTWWSGCAPPPTDACAGPADLDLDVVRVVYAVLSESVACGICGAPLDTAADVERTRRLLAASRIVVATQCRGPLRHRHLAKVTDRAGDLRLGPLRPS